MRAFIDSTSPSKSSSASSSSSCFFWRLMKQRNKNEMLSTTKRDKVLFFPTKPTKFASFIGHHERPFCVVFPFIHGQQINKIFIHETTNEKNHMTMCLRFVGVNDGMSGASASVSSYFALFDVIWPEEGLAASIPDGGQSAVDAGGMDNVLYFDVPKLFSSRWLMKFQKRWSESRQSGSLNSISKEAKISKTTTIWTTQMTPSSRLTEMALRKPIKQIKWRTKEKKKLIWYEIISAESV